MSKNFTRISSDIHLCHFLDTNIFGYSFVSKPIRMLHSDLLALSIERSLPCARSVLIQLLLIQSNGLSLSASNQPTVNEQCSSNIVKRCAAIQSIFVLDQLFPYLKICPLVYNQNTKTCRLHRPSKS